MASTSARHRRTSARPLRSLRHALPLRGIFRLRPAADIWHKPALSAVIALGTPEAVLLATGHLELAFYTAAGGLCALYAHSLPYAARARALAWVVLGMLAGTGVALTAAALIDSTAVRVGVIALLAAAHKVVCDATRIGPPANVVLTFAASSAAFVPQRLAELPLHLALVLLGGLLAWLVCMAPALVRPRGPERIAVARALEATAALLRAKDGAGDTANTQRYRREAAAAAGAAWNTLFLVPVRACEQASELAFLVGLLVRAESLAAAPGGHAPHDAGLLLDRGRDLRKGCPLPEAAGRDGEAYAAENAEILGVTLEQAARRRANERRAGGFRSAVRAFGPGSPLLPIGSRVAVGAALAGWASMALGVDRPYWAVVTAAAVFSANTALSWHRSLQRVLGNLVGVLLFTALIPLTGTGRAALVAVALVCQFSAEATIARNYWLATVFVTPMALAMTQFAGREPTHLLVMGRWLDTCVGAAAGLLACFLVPNRRVTGRVEASLGRVDAAVARARVVLGSGKPRGPEHSAVRARLTGALLDLRESADTAAGEWWSSALPEERIIAAERSCHQLLAELVARWATAEAAAP